MSAKNTEEIVVSFEGVKMKDFRAYWAAVARGNWAEQDAFFAKVVRSWPFELDPVDPNSYKELGLEAYVAVQTAIKKASAQTGMELVRLSFTSKDKVAS